MTVNPDGCSARQSDLPGIQALLKNEGLPFEDLAAGSMPDFVVQRGPDGKLLAIGGIECHGSNGLLRSLVVIPDARGKGVGRKVIDALENHARQKGVKALYLLTTTAPEYFPRLGYESFDRSAVPSAISGSAEFASLCPASAICMKKNLE